MPSRAAIRAAAASGQYLFLSTACASQRHLLSGVWISIGFSCAACENLRVGTVPEYLSNSDTNRRQAGGGIASNSVRIVLHQQSFQPGGAVIQPARAISRQP